MLLQGDLKEVVTKCIRVSVVSVLPKMTVLRLGVFALCVSAMALVQEVLTWLAVGTPC